MNGKVNFYCPQCGTYLEAAAEMSGMEVVCPNCNKSMVVPPPAVQEETRGSGKIDLSNDRDASVYRWLKAIRWALYCGFSVSVFELLGLSLSLMTIFAALILLFAAAILVCGICRGAPWAKIALYLNVALFVITMVCDSHEVGILDWVGCVSLILAVVMLMLPKVSRKLKELGQSSKPTWKVALLYWGLLILAGIFISKAPDSKGLWDYNIPKGVGVIVFLTFGYALEFIAGKLVAETDDIMGGAIRDDHFVGSTKTRNVSCPKCGQVIVVPDTDDNDQISCPACNHLFYPFGCSSLAVLAFYLGLFSVVGILAPFALAVGIYALKDIKKNRGKHGITRAWTGIILGGIGTGCVLCGLIVVLCGK